MCRVLALSSLRFCCLQKTEVRYVLIFASSPYRLPGARGRPQIRALLGIATEYRCYNERIKTDNWLAMQITITAAPVFHVPFTLDELRLLNKMAASHYDGVCQATSRPGPGAFLYGWLGRAEFAATQPGADSSVQKFQATTRELDITLKVLENSFGLPDAEQTTARRLSRNLLGAVRYAVDEVAPCWKAVFAGMHP